MIMGFYENILWKPPVKRERGGWYYVVKCCHYKILDCIVLALRFTEMLAALALTLLSLSLLR